MYMSTISLLPLHFPRNNLLVVINDSTSSNDVTSDSNQTLAVSKNLLHPSTSSDSIFVDKKMNDWQNKYNNLLSRFDLKEKYKIRVFTPTTSFLRFANQ